MNTLRDALGNMTQTENGAPSFVSTGHACLDFFAHAGALRAGGLQNINRAVDLFNAAFEQDPALAITILFYIRDVRGGQGEREVFRRVLLYLADIHPAHFNIILRYIPVYGRWDDLLIFGPHKNVGMNVVSHVHRTWRQDQLNAMYKEPISLLAKWMPSENTSSCKTRDFAHFWIGQLMAGRGGERRYRKVLSNLRARLNVVERQMSAGQWDKIDYEQVPARAMYIYRKAFMKHDPERFKAYIAASKEGKAKIHAGALYPYEIISKILNQGEDETLSALWKALPNYFPSEDINAICVCDTSGSMSMYGSAMPLWVSTSLTLYAAERSRGPFADTAITFSAKPEFITLPRTESLTQRMERLLTRSGYNTNFQAVFEMILDAAIRMSVPQSEMPTDIFVISDMQFDQADGSAMNPISPQVKLHAPTNFELVREKYREAGYQLPRFTMWNVRAASDQPVTMKEPGVFLVSGCSPVIFEHALSFDTSVVSPVDAMMRVLLSERLRPIYDTLR